MKKIVMMAVMAVAALSANAQVWVGGEVGFTSSHVNGLGIFSLLFFCFPLKFRNFNR